MCLMSIAQKIGCDQYSRILLFAVIAFIVAISPNLCMAQACDTTSMTFMSAARTPSTGNAADGSTMELGTRFQSDVPGYISAIRYYRAPSETGEHWGIIWGNVVPCDRPACTMENTVNPGDGYKYILVSGVKLVEIKFTNEPSGSGWREQKLATPLAITAHTDYIVSVNVNSHFVADFRSLKTQIVNGPLHTTLDEHGNGPIGCCNLPRGTLFSALNEDGNYYRDIRFQRCLPGTGVAPSPSMQGRELPRKGSGPKAFQNRLFDLQGRLVQDGSYRTPGGGVKLFVVSDQAGDVLSIRVFAH